jgi:hypothetical protein
VRVQGVSEVDLPVLDPGMADHDDVSPGDMDITSQHDNAVTNRVNRLSEALGAPTIGDPILAKMTATAKSA